MQTQSELRAHFEVERELAAKLRNSTREARSTLYKDVYDELFRRVPHHPQLIEGEGGRSRASRAARQVKFLLSITSPKPVFVEIGPGNCITSVAMAGHSDYVYAVDVSTEITGKLIAPANFRLLLSDGCSIDVAPGSVDLVFSNQLMEHLHPDDAMEQLCNIHRVLKPEGKYFCITPNRLSGPHDISQHFANVACGFHLREYSLQELLQVFKLAGFSKFRIYIGKDGYFIRIPLWVGLAAETAISALPHRVRKRVAKMAPLRLLLGIRLLALKA